MDWGSAGTNLSASPCWFSGDQNELNGGHDGWNLMSPWRQSCVLTRGARRRLAGALQNSPTAKTTNCFRVLEDEILVRRHRSGAEGRVG